MKQAQPDTEHGQKAAAGQIRSRPARQQTIKPSGHLAQLAAMANASPRVETLKQLKGAAQQNPYVQTLVGLAAEINQGAPVQRQSRAKGLENGFNHAAQPMIESALDFTARDQAEEGGTDPLPELSQPANGVAQRVMQSEVPTNSGADGLPRTEVMQLQPSARTMIALAAAAGIVGITYILTRFGPTYAWIWLKIRISGANPNLSVQDLVQLSTNLPAFSYDDIIRFGGLNLTVAQITQLGGIAVVNNDPNNLMALGGIANRTVAEIVQISALAGIGAPTVQQIVTISATAFNVADLGQFANLAQIQTAAELIQVANIALPAATIVGIAGFPQAPSAAEIVALAAIQAAGIPLPTLAAIAARPAFINAQAILNFLNLPLAQPQSAANKLRLALLNNMPLVTAMDMLLALRAFALTNQAGRIVFRFNGGTWANAQADCIAVFGALGNNIVAGQGNAPNGQLKELYRIMAHGVTVICRSWSSEAHVLATIEIQAGPTYEFKYQ
jgi:hypothetical protein